MAFRIPNIPDEQDELQQQAAAELAARQRAAQAKQATYPQNLPAPGPMTTAVQAPQAIPAPMPVEPTQPKSVSASPGVVVPGPTGQSLPPIDQTLHDLYKKRISQYEAPRQSPWANRSKPLRTAGKFVHGLEKAGNIALDVMAPQIAAVIPGTELHGAIEERRNESGLENADKNIAAQEAARGKSVNQDKFIHFYESGGKTIGVRADGSTEELPGATPKPSYSIQKFTETGPDGKPHDVQYVIDQNKLNGLTPGPEGFTREQLQQAGALTQLNLGAAAAKPISSNTGRYKMVPTGPDTEALADFTMPDAKTGTPYTIISPAKESGSYQAWVDPNHLNAPPKLFNTKTRQIEDLVPPKGETITQATGGTVPPTAARASIMQQDVFRKDFELPAENVDQNYQKFQEAYKEYQADPDTGAASMVALAQHLGSTFGSVAHTTMGEKMIQEHKDAIGLLSRLDRYFDSLSTGQQLSAEQWQDFNSLLTKTRQIQWQTTAREAALQNIPVKMVPRDVRITMLTSKGTRADVPGDRVMEGLEHGLTIQ